MRDLMIKRILEIHEGAGDLESQNAMLYLLGQPLLAGHDFDLLSNCVSYATDEQLLLLYDLLSTEPYKWGVMFGIDDDTLIV